MTGDSSVALYPKELVKFFGDECEPGDKDKLYRRVCSRVIRSHLHNLHNKERAAGAEQRFSFYKTLTDSYEAWFQMWEEECYREFGDADEVIKKKLQLYGAIGASFLRTYWKQNEKLADPYFSFSPGQLLKYQHPYAQTGEEFLSAYVSQIREVPLSWIKRVRPTLIRNGKLIDRYNEVVLVVLKADFWEAAPEIDVRRDHRIVICDRRPLRNNSFVNKVKMAYRSQSATCVRATWLYKKLYGDYPVAVVFYQLLTGICCATWPKYVPKVVKKIPPKPKRGEAQYALDFIQPVHPHPFEDVEVLMDCGIQVPWSGLKRNQVLDKP